MSPGGRSEAFQIGVDPGSGDDRSATSSANTVETYY